MAFDGAGTFLRLYSWVVDATNSVKIRADRHDNEDNNFAEGLSHCITKDGQTSITQNIPFNSRRIVSLADPIDPQDAATKDYADTKLDKVGNGTVTGNLTVSGNLDVGGTASATGYKVRRGLAGPYGSNFFNFDWKVGNVEAWIDNTFVGNMATQAYADTAANNSAAGKVNRSGDTITGNLMVNGEVGSGLNVFRFGAVGSSPGYLQWNGGGNYALGGGGTIWHSGNLNPAALGSVSGVQLAIAGDFLPVGNNLNEPFAGAVVSMATIHTASGGVWCRCRYLQIKTTGNWFTVSYA